MSDDSDENPIDKALGINASVPDVIKDTVATIISNVSNDSASEDFTFARAKIRGVLEDGIDAYGKLASVADQSQNPRAYEVLAKFMDSIVNASERLLEVQKKIREIDGVDQPRNDDAKSVTNNLFVGSTAELQKVLAEMNNGSKQPDR